MLSIIIPVKGQIHYTKDVLKDIRDKISSPFEVIVIDDNSGDGTKEWLEANAGDYGARFISYLGDQGVNSAWNDGVTMAKGDHVLILNNDVVLTKGVDVELIEALEKEGAKIACPFTTEGRHKFMLPVKRKQGDVAGWCFLMRRSEWFPIPPSLDLWYGDTWQFHKAEKKVAWAGLVHHYVSKTIFSPEMQKKAKLRIARDKLAWDILAQENGFTL